MVEKFGGGLKPIQQEKIYLPYYKKNYWLLRNDHKMILSIGSQVGFLYILSYITQLLIIGLKY